NERTHCLLGLAARGPNHGALSRTSSFEAMIEPYDFLHLIFPAPGCFERCGDALVPLDSAFLAHRGVAQGINMLSSPLPVVVGAPFREPDRAGRSPSCDSRRSMRRAPPPRSRAPARHQARRR